MSLVPEIKRVSWKHKLNLKAEINLLLSKYQKLSAQSGPQSNNSGVPLYYQHRPLEHDNFSQFIYQPQQPLHTSADYNQLPPNYGNSSEHYRQHFTGTQPTESQLFQQEPHTINHTQLQHQALWGVIIYCRLQPIYCHNLTYKVLHKIYLPLFLHTLPLTNVFIF